MFSVAFVLLIPFMSGLKASILVIAMPFSLRMAMYTINLPCPKDGSFETGLLLGMRFFFLT